MEEHLMFYSGLLDDQMEEGLSEEEAVAAAGPVEEIVRQTISDTPLTKIVKERIRPKRRLHAGELVLLVLGAPIRLPLGFAAIAVFFALYVVLWSALVSLWAGFVSVGAGAVGGVLAGIGLIAGRGAATKGIEALTRRIAVWTKNRFLRREDI